MLPAVTTAGFEFDLAPWPADPARPRGFYGTKYAHLSQVISAMEQQVLAQGHTPTDAATEAGRKIKPLLPE